MSHEYKKENSICCKLHIKPVHASNRSKKYKENNIVKGFVRPLLDLFDKYNVGIEQLPCVEVFYEGLTRKASGQDHYNTEKFKELCNKFAEQIVYLIDQYIKAGYKVCCIIGVDGSPTCGINLTSLGKGRWSNDRGIFMKILEEKLKEKGYKIPMIGARFKSYMEFRNFLKEVEKHLRD